MPVCSSTSKRDRDFVCVMLWLMVTGPDGSASTFELTTVVGRLAGEEQPISPAMTNRVKISDHLGQQDVFIFIFIPGDFPWFSIV